MGLGSRKSDQARRKEVAVAVAVAVCPSMFDYRSIFATFVQFASCGYYESILGFCRKVP